MKKLNRLSEVFAGLVILVAVGIFLVSMLHTALSRSSSTYALKADFKDAGGLTSGGDVTMKGVVIGKVKSVTITKDYQVEVVMRIYKNIRVPVDSAASITNASFFSGRNVSVTPGQEERYLSSGDYIQNTKDYMYLEDKISTALFK